MFSTQIKNKINTIKKLYIKQNEKKILFPNPIHSFYNLFKFLYRFVNSPFIVENNKQVLGNLQSMFDDTIHVFLMFW